MPASITERVARFAQLAFVCVRFFVRRIFVKEHMAEATVDDDVKALTPTHEVCSMGAVCCDECAMWVSR